MSKNNGSRNITGLTSLRFNPEDKKDFSNDIPSFTLPQVDDVTKTSETFKNSDNSNHPILLGTGFYDHKSNNIQFALKENPAGENYKTSFKGMGNMISNGAFTDKHIVIYDEASKAFKDSGVEVKAAAELAFANTQANQNRFLIGNLGAIQFIGDDASVLLNDLSSFTMHTQGAGAASRVCTVFSGDLPTGSSSPSAVLELNTSEGVLLLSRLNNNDENSLVDLKNGSFWYNSETDNFRVKKAGNIINFGEGSAELGDISVTLDSNFDPAQKTKFENVTAIKFRGSSPDFKEKNIYVKDTNPNQIFFTGDPTITSLYSGLTIKNQDNDGGFEVALGGGLGGQTSLTLRDAQGTLLIKKPYTASPINLHFTFPATDGQTNQVLVWGSNSTKWSSTPSHYNVQDLIGDIGYYPVVTDSILNCNTLAGEVRIDLLDITYSQNKGHVLIVKDTSGSAGIAGKNIIIGGATIDGNSSYTINTAYGFVVLYCYGTGWAVIGK